MDTILLLTAATLGLLAFFEPCTIATHTLFAARTNRDSDPHRRVALIQLVAARTALLASALSVAAWWGVGEIAPGVAVAALGFIGAIYLVSRRLYLPVPHIEFFRLLPGHGRLSHALKLGLTLPACTLPLVALTAMLSALTHKPDIAALAGAVFAAMFSLPTVWDTLRGLSIARRAFLARVATATPYLTAVLLWSGALVIWQTGA